MAYDQELARRLRALLEKRSGFAEKKMFGGVCFLLRGNMACGILNDELIVRAGPDAYASLLEEPGVRQFDITGKPMRGWLMVSARGYGADEDLAAWVERAAAFALSLPAK